MGNYRENKVQLNRQVDYCFFLSWVINTALIGKPILKITKFEWMYGFIDQPFW